MPSLFGGGIFMSGGIMQEEWLFKLINYGIGSLLAFLLFFVVYLFKGHSISWDFDDSLVVQGGKKKRKLSVDNSKIREAALVGIAGAIAVFLILLYLGSQRII
jgi:hypothetical protein